MYFQYYYNFNYSNIEYTSIISTQQKLQKTISITISLLIQKALLL